MGISNQQKNLHLLWRAGFGPAAEELQQITSASPTAYFKALVKASAKEPAYIDVADNALKGLFMGVGDIVRQQQEMTAEKRRMYREKSRDALKNLNLAWMSEMVNSQQQLREKLSLFWHGHFAARVINIFYQQQLIDIVRKNALGNFGDLLRDVSKSASMINFLNNNQNKKGHPNENFAREVMELFTMGRGNYTETDIKEAARAFTGWGVETNGEFVFRQNQHDGGTKTIFGKTGNFKGEDVLDMLLEKKQTAVYITQKIYRYFVNDQVDAVKVEWLANRFYKSNYEILPLLTDIFTSDWFYDEKNIGSRIKSPVELLVGIRRILPMDIQNEEVLLLLQRILGQLLFYPPNVAGWAGGKNWIDSSTLMMRLRIPQLVYAGDSFQMKPKDDDDQMMGMMDKSTTTKKKPAPRKGGQQISASVNWPIVLKQFEKTSREQLLQAIGGVLFPVKHTFSDIVLKNYINASNREDYIKTGTIQLMSTPEYQLC